MRKLPAAALFLCLVFPVFSCCQQEKKTLPPVEKTPISQQPAQVTPAPKPAPEPAPKPTPPTKPADTNKPVTPPPAPPVNPEPVSPAPEKKPTAPALESISGPAAPGDTVSVLYKGTLDDGSVFDASDRHGNQPLTFVAGKPGVIKGFSDGVIGMKVAEKKTLHIKSDDAYGPYRDGAVISQPMSMFKQDPNLRVGMMIPMTNQQGQTFRFTVTKIEGETVTLDANHPLAGKNLNFDVEMVKIERPVASAAPEPPAAKNEPAPVEQAAPAE